MNGVLPFECLSFVHPVSGSICLGRRSNSVGTEPSCLLDDLAAIISQLSIELTKADGLDVVSCGAKPDLRNPFDLVDRWEQLNIDDHGEVPALPEGFALFEIEFRLAVTPGTHNLPETLRRLTEKAVSRAVTPDRDEKIGSPRSICWTSTLMH